MTKLLEQAIGELRQLESLPEEEQNTWAASILRYLRTWRDQKEEGSGEAKPYSSFDVLRKAQLPGPFDASVTYERELYGRTAALDN